MKNFPERWWIQITEDNREEVKDLLKETEVRNHYFSDKAYYGNSLDTGFTSWGAYSLPISEKNFVITTEQFRKFRDEKSLSSSTLNNNSMKVFHTFEFGNREITLAAVEIRDNYFSVGYAVKIEGDDPNPELAHTISVGRAESDNRLCEFDLNVTVLNLEIKGIEEDTSEEKAGAMTKKQFNGARKRVTTNIVLGSLIALQQQIEYRNIVIKGIR